MKYYKLFFLLTFLFLFSLEADNKQPSPPPTPSQTQQDHADKRKIANKINEIFDAARQPISKAKELLQTAASGSTASKIKKHREAIQLYQEAIQSYEQLEEFLDSLAGAAKTVKQKQEIKEHQKTLEAELKKSRSVKCHLEKELQNLSEKLQWEQLLAIKEKNEKAIISLEKKIKLPEDSQKTSKKIQLLNQFIADIGQIIKYFEEIQDAAQKISSPEQRKQLKDLYTQLTKILKSYREAKTARETEVAILQAQLHFDDAIKIAEQTQTSLLQCPIPNTLQEQTEAASLFAGAAKNYRKSATSVQKALDYIAALSLEADKKTLKAMKADFESSAQLYEQEASLWNARHHDEIQALTQHLMQLQETCSSLYALDKDLEVWQTQKLMLPVLEELASCGMVDKQECDDILANINAYQTPSSSVSTPPSILPEEITPEIEKQRQQLFFRRQTASTHPSSSLVEKFSSTSNERTTIPLDGQHDHNNNHYTLYIKQLYRFLVQHDHPIAKLRIHVYQDNLLVHEEQLVLPSYDSNLWEHYLHQQEMLYTPKTSLNKDFGLDLRLSFVPSTTDTFSIIIGHKCHSCQYQFALFLEDQKEALYQFDTIESPPWQLGSLKKPALSSPIHLLEHQPQNGDISLDHISMINSIELSSHHLLNEFVEEMNRDPLALTQYVYNEIDLVDPFLLREDGVFQAPSIHRSALTVFLEKQGSPWEQCALLVYLLRQAGHEAVYLNANPYTVSAKFVENLLLTDLPGQKKATLNYPGVLFFDASTQKWISLFPWMKEAYIEEGFDLYSVLPEEYGNADRWIKRYLCNDPQIMQHVSTDNDDTAGVLFTRFVSDLLRQQGLSLQDVGIHRHLIKKQFVSWNDFPRPQIPEKFHVLSSLNQNPELFAFFKIDLLSCEDHNKRLETEWMPLALINGRSFQIHFSASGEDQHLLHFCLPLAWEKELLLHNTDRNLYLQASYARSATDRSYDKQKIFTFAKGTTATFDFHFGNANAHATSMHGEIFRQSTSEHRLHTLLSFIGALYFEKCDKAEKQLAALHKTHPRTVIGFGLSKLSPDLSNGPLKGDPDLKFPQVDMIRLYHPASTGLSIISFHQERNETMRQFTALTAVDASSNEHQVLKEVFQDPYAVSTVKLLQIAHQEHQKQQQTGAGFLLFTSKSFAEADRVPITAHWKYFGQFKNLHLERIKRETMNQWDALKNAFNSTSPSSIAHHYTYAYMTPWPICSQDGNGIYLPSYQGMGTLIIHPQEPSALISDNPRMLNGGFGSRLSDGKTTSIAKKELEIVPYKNSFTLKPTRTSPSKINSITFETGTSLFTQQYESDIRHSYKGLYNFVADPVDVVSGAYYVDDVDISLSGPFPLSIRRNYNSINPIQSPLGIGWKLSLNPYLVEEGNKRYVTEEDGSVIVYTYQSNEDRWVVLPSDNPELSNFSVRGVGSIANPFHAYIQNNILYGTDGSKRYFDKGLLQKWIDCKGNTLTFFYNDYNQLKRIESSNGSFIGLRYNHEGRISEAYTKDGRRVYYAYDTQGNLIEVSLPNGATIIYEYDSHHRIIREIRPHGKVIENTYDDQGRISQQRTPIGSHQELQVSAEFSYFPNLTYVYDAAKACTTYHLYGKRIYKIVDPMGVSTFQSWFIDENSWFDAKTAQILPWDGPGAWSCSLKASNDKRGLTTEYRYDNNGNPKEIRLIGNDLTGRGDKETAKYFTYNEHQLCTEETLLHTTTLTTYDEHFPYLPKKIEKYAHGQLISFVECQYNPLGQLERENHNGSITIWQYDERGFPTKKTQETGTYNPEVTTTFVYNEQGQCVHSTTTDAIQIFSYDIMGNQLKAEVYDLKGVLLTASYAGYDLNNMPI